MSDYADFLSSKQRTFAGDGIDVPADALNSALFPFQRDLVRWALLRAERAAHAVTRRDLAAANEEAKRRDDVITMHGALSTALDTIEQTAQAAWEARR